jgi:hypothetical protein
VKLSDAKKTKNYLTPGLSCSPRDRIVDEGGCDDGSGEFWDETTNATVPCEPAPSEEQIGGRGSSGGSRGRQQASLSYSDASAMIQSIYSRIQYYDQYHSLDMLKQHLELLGSAADSGPDIFLNLLSSFHKSATAEGAFANTPADPSASLEQVGTRVQPGPQSKRKHGHYDKERRRRRGSRKSTVPTAESEDDSSDSVSSFPSPPLPSPSRATFQGEISSSASPAAQNRFVSFFRLFISV